MSSTPVSRFSSSGLRRVLQTALAYARVWHHVDASDRILGKLAERIALVLMGKHKPIFDAAGLSPLFTERRDAFYSPYLKADCGDYVVVTNAKRIKVSGRKDEQVLYRKHSMYPGGLKEIKYKEMMQRKPDEVRHTLSWGGEIPTHFLSHCIDHSTGGIWDVAEKQTTGEETGEAPYFSRRGYGHFPAQYCKAMGRRHSHIHPTNGPPCLYHRHRSTITPFCDSR